jgi:hypothetical protein
MSTDFYPRLGIALALTAPLLFSGCTRVHKSFVSKVKAEFAKQPLKQEEVLTDADIAHLPDPVRAYLAYTKVVGKPKPQNFRIVFDAQMWRKPGSKPMQAASVQYNFLGENPARLFYMTASQLLVPFRVLHAYANREATMQVRVAGLFNAVNIRGTPLTEAETVTLLNDLCAFAPGALADSRFTWSEPDSMSARVTFANGPYRISAVLHFNAVGELVNFVSDDRSALQDDGSLKKVRWSTPLSDYQDFEGRRIPTHGEAVYHYPKGDFTYGAFSIRSIAFNVKEYRAR